MEGSKINDMSSSENSDLLAAARCLKDYLVPHGWGTQTCDVLMFLASETEKRLMAGKEARFTNVSIQAAVQRTPTADPSKWMSRIWDDLIKKALPEREAGLQAFARAKGLNVYPWAGKVESSGGAGNQAFYYLDVRRIAAVQTTPAREMVKSLDPGWAVTYIPELTPDPSWWTRWIFDKSRSATGWRKWLVLLIPLGWLALAMGLAVIAWLGLSNDKTPLTTQSFVFVLFTGGVGAYGIRIFREWHRFLDDRIAPAPDHLVALHENGVCIELHKPSDAPRCIRLVRYASQCPVCNAQVLLCEGGRDFPGRLVGRCQESPKEHVFSFDRVTLKGGWLRGRDLQG